MNYFSFHAAGECGPRLKYDARFQMAVRERNRDLLKRAFPGDSNAETADKAHKRSGYSARQITNWLNCYHDMPSHVADWLKLRVAEADALAERIEGRK